MTAAEVYNDCSTHQATRGNELIEQLKPQIGMRVLDIGCGTGYLASVWANLVGPTGRVTGVDPDKERIELAREQYGGKDNLTFCEGSTDNLPQGEFDVIFCNLVFHWVKDKKNAFKNVHRNLRSGGRFGLVAAETMLPMISDMIDLMREEHSKRLYDRWRSVSLKQYEELAHSVGFNFELSLSTPQRMEFSNIDVLMKWWKGTTHGDFDTAFIDEPVLRAFREGYKDKPVVLSWPFVVMILVK